MSLQEKKRPRTTKIVKNERQIAQERIQKNQAYYMKLTKALELILNGKATKKNLLAYILPTMNKHNLKVERMMRRSKQIIYCWICEHISLFPDLQSIVTCTWPYEEHIGDKLSDMDTQSDDFLNEILLD